MLGIGAVWVQRIVWLILLALFVVGESVTVGLTSVWFAAGALAALFAAMLGGGVPLQIAVFSVVSLVCLLVARPLAKRYFVRRPQPTNADRIIGAEAVVTEAIDNIHGTGAVTAGGIVWTARSGGEGVIPVGTRVRVDRIEGVKVYVEEIKEAVKC